jgi:uncharacterized protein (TIRG00374 family)
VSRKRSLDARLILRGLRIALGLILLVFALQGVQWSELRRSLALANPAWLLLALGVVAGGLILKIWRWAMLLGNFGFRFPFRRIGQAYLAGQAANILLPIRGGEIVRIGMMEQGDAGSLARLAATIAIEKFLDLLALTALSLLVLPSLAALGSPYLPQVLAAFAATAVVFLVVYVFWAERLWAVVEKKTRGSRSRWVVRFVTGIGQFIASSAWLRDGRKIVSPLLVTLIIWSLMWAANLPVLRSVGLGADPLTAGVVLALVYIGLIPALMPGNIGPFYFFAQLALRAFTIPLDQALAFAILLHAIVTLPVLAIGGVILLMPGKYRGAWYN